MAQRAPEIAFSRLRGELVELADGIVVVNDCYNANPISMRAALDHLASLPAPGRHVAVLGEMAELGPSAPQYHREAGSHARQLGVGPLIGVGGLARDYAPDAWAPDAEAAVPLAEAMLQPGDALLVKGSRSVGLELVTDELIARRGRPCVTLARGRSPARSRRRPIDRGQILIAGMAAMLITIFLGPRFIEFLRAREFGQQIREEGPAEHQTKAGTPTMGGLIVFVAIAVPYLVLSPLDTAEPGGLRRRARRRRPRVSRTTSSRSPSAAPWASRLAGSCLPKSPWRVGLWWVANEEVGLESSLQVRISDAEIYIGPVLYVMVVFLVIAGASNAVNLTDGLDGLAAGSCAIVLLAYTAITITSGQEGLALLSACLVGASVGFLWFNSFPAAIFMGDTGSLGLGAAIGALAVMTQTELLLIILGGIFVIEAVSVAVQVLSFKLFRRRVLLMAPVHHHFEMMAWSETKIMLRFWIVAAVCAGIGYTLYQNSIG